MVQVHVSRKLIAGLAGAVGLLAAGTTPIAGAETRTVVPMPGVLKRCDFSAATYVPATGDARALARIGTGPGTVVADVELLTALPNTRYGVRLIQLPRPSLTCSAADPGVVAGTLDTDALGAATSHLDGPLLPGSTGAWVFIDRPAEFSQTPAEHYSSDFVADI